jgi:hypothetical protein
MGWVRVRRREWRWRGRVVVCWVRVVAVVGAAG